MSWLFTTPINYWLLAFWMFSIWNARWGVMLFAAGYVQTGPVPDWVKMVFAAYFFPTGQWHRRYENRPLSRGARGFWKGALFLNLLVNLAVMALPMERACSLAWRGIKTWFD